MQSFLDVVFPPFILLAGVAGVVAFTGWLVVKRVRLWQAQVNKINADQQALNDAVDAVSAIITSDFNPDVKDKALTAYDALRKLGANTKKVTR